MAQILWLTKMMGMFSDGIDQFGLSGLESPGDD